MDDIIRNQINAFSMDDHIAVSRVNKEFTTIRNTSIDEYFVAYTKRETSLQLKPAFKQILLSKLFKNRLFL